MPTDCRDDLGETERVWPARWVVLLLIGCALVTSNPRARSWNDKSRLAATESIVERGTLAIDDTSFGTFHDKVYIGGHYYCDKPITPSLLGAAVYWPIFQAGFEIREGANLACYLIILLTVKVLWVLGLLGFYDALRHTGLMPRSRLILMFLLAFCSLHLSWSSVFNNHSMAASTLILGLAIFLRVKQGQARPGWLALAGVCLAFAAACDQPTAIFGLGLLIYILFHPVLRKGLAGFILAGLLVVAPGLVINYAISGSIMPVQINPEHFDYPDSPWVDSMKLSGVGMNTPGFALSYGFDLLLGIRGFVLHNPLLLVALPLMVWVVARRGPLWVESLIIGLGSIVIFAYYCFMTTGYGGSCYSIRWFVPLLPLMFLYLYPAVERMSLPAVRWTIGVLAVVSLMAALMGLVNPWPEYKSSRYPVVDNYYFLLTKVKRKLGVEQPQEPQAQRPNSTI